MSSDDKRNTAIVKLNGWSSLSISDLQGFPTTTEGNGRSLHGFGALASTLLNLEIRSKTKLATMSYDDNRNTMINYISNLDIGFSVSDLQAMDDLTLVRKAVNYYNSLHALA